LTNKTVATLSTLAMLTEVFSSEHIEAAARQTGFVKRASNITGTIFLPVVTFGGWSAANTTFAPLAAQVTPCVEHLEVSPEAIDQRMHKRAHALLQEMIQPACATIHARTPECDDGLLASLAKVHIADSPGFERPASLKDSFPGAGGSAATAGATIQAVWDDKSRTCAHVALTPWTIPDQKYIDHVVALAHHDVLFICALGYCKIQACTRLVAADAYF
jgi:hypothetical protein